MQIVQLDKLDISSGFRTLRCWKPGLNRATKPRSSDLRPNLWPRAAPTARPPRIPVHEETGVCGTGLRADDTERLGTTATPPLEDAPRRTAYSARLRPRRTRQPPRDQCPPLLRDRERNARR